MASSIEDFGVGLQARVDFQVRRHGLRSGKPATGNDRPNVYVHDAFENLPLEVDSFVVA